MVLNHKNISASIFNFFLSLMLLTIGLLFGVLVAEIWIRIYRPQPLFVKITLPNFDESTGIPKNSPLHMRYSTEEYTTDWQINTLGFHDTEHQIGPHANVYRIVILGDSFTEAAQVPLDDTWYKQLEERLQKLTNQKIEIINLGIGGAGTGWELLILEKIGMQYEPNLVLLAFDLGSDFFNNHPLMEDKFEKPFFIIRNGRVFFIDHEQLEVRIRGVWMPLWRISHLYRYLHRTLYKINKEARLIKNQMPIFFEQYLSNPPSRWDEAKKYTHSYIKEILALTQKNKCRFVVVAAPDKYQIYSDWWIELKNKWPIMQNKKWNLDAPTERLKRILTQLNIPFINLVPILREKTLSTDRLYFKKDIHWNTLGNRIVAEAIAENIIKYMQ